jgi:alkyl sulfatase BDS1-like metallo-beta-lactamase superfamily hydrolase
MGAIAVVAEQLWNGEVSTEERHPFTPLMAIEEVADGVSFVSSFANVGAIRADDRLLLVDTGGYLMGPMVFGMLRGWSPAPVSTAVYTHGHIDHVGGIERFDEEAERKKWPKPQVIAHRALPARFDRYQSTAGWNSCINARQFGSKIDWPVRYRYPDQVYESTRTIDHGGITVELHHARGETDDHTWAWVPSKKVLFTGDLFIWAAPNAGNPQKVQRYPREWAVALRAMAALGAEVLLPGHGVPIYGAARVRQAVSETAELLESLHDQTLAMMNAGARLDEILHAVKAPAHLLERPYLKPVYDDPQFIVRNIWRLYGGWWDGNPSRLKPAPDAAVAREVATLAGGAARLADRAQALLDGGDLALAAHLAELAWQAAPDDAAVKGVRKRVYARRAEAEPSLMARGIFRAASDDS